MRRVVFFFFFVKDGFSFVTREKVRRFLSQTNKFCRQKLGFDKKYRCVNFNNGEQKTYWGLKECIFIIAFEVRACTRSVDFSCSAAPFLLLFSTIRFALNAVGNFVIRVIRTENYMFFVRITHLSFE